MEKFIYIIPFETDHELLGVERYHPKYYAYMNHVHCVPPKCYGEGDYKRDYFIAHVIDGDNRFISAQPDVIRINADTPVLKLSSLGIDVSKITDESKYAQKDRAAVEWINDDVLAEGITLGDILKGNEVVKG